MINDVDFYYDNATETYKVLKPEQAKSALEKAFGGKVALTRKDDGMQIIIMQGQIIALSMYMQTNIEEENESERETSMTMMLCAMMALTVQMQILMITQLAERDKLISSQQIQLEYQKEYGTKVGDYKYYKHFGENEFKIESQKAAKELEVAMRKVPNLMKNELNNNKVVNNDLEQVKNNNLNRNLSLRLKK